MTVKLVVLYTQPDDPDAFDAHYLGEHVALAMAVPGLQRFESGRIVSAIDGGELGYYRTAELTFADEAALQAGFASEQGKAAGADYERIAPAGSRMYVEVLD